MSRMGGWYQTSKPPNSAQSGNSPSTRFHYAQDTVFNATTYGAFLERLGRHYRRRGAMLIQDNASYHKDKDVWGWFKSNRHWLEVHQLPAYCPELNPTERIWQHTRRTGT